MIRFPPNDLPQAISVCELLNVSTDERKKYFVVGSAIEISTEDEPKDGKIRIYEVIESGGRRRLNVCVDTKVTGSVYCVDACDGRLICGIGSTVRSPQTRINKQIRIYDVKHDDLLEVGTYRSPLAALTLSIRQPFILLGDLMKSVMLFRLDNARGILELTSVARDYAPLWMTSVAILEDGWFLGAEDSGNLVGWKRDDDLTPDEARLSMVQEMRFGEMINRIRLGISSYD